VVLDPQMSTWITKSMGRNSPKVTIRDLAKQANVSPATVSRVLNNSGYVSEEVRERVEKAITDSGYLPDTRARELRGKPSNLVALIIPNIKNVFYTTLAEAVETNLRDLGFTMVLGISQEDPLIFLDYLQSFGQRRVDGILYVPPAVGEFSKQTRQLVIQGVPMVEVNRRKEDDLLDGVVADNFQGAYQATKHLIGMGHKRIALIVGSNGINTGHDRIQGYKQAMHDAGLETDPSFLKIGAFVKEYGVQATEELLNLPVRPTAIFSASNRLALGTISALTEHNIKVPNDISVIAFDNVEWFQYFNPPITTVDIAIEEMAVLAVQLLMRRIQEDAPPQKPRTYSLSTMLIERKSCRRITPEES
jgi:LacI family transcriptional regulator